MLELRSRIDNMLAINFIKEYEIDKARDVVKRRPIGGDYFNPKTWKYSLEKVPKGFLVSELARIVESIDLVEHMKGIKEVKKKFRDNGSLHGNRMKIIIADYESVYGVEEA